MEFNDLRLFSIFFVAALLAGNSATGAVPKSSKVIVESSDVIEISASRGVLIRLARPASTVFVANPKVADIQMKSPRLVYVLGKAPGETTFFAVDAKERVLANRRILVTHNLSRLRDSLKSMLPRAVLDVRSVDSSIVIAGRVRTIIEAAEVRRVAERFVDKPDDRKVASATS